MEDILYQYPIEEFKEATEKEFISGQFRQKKLVYTVIALFAFSFLFIFLYSISSVSLLSKTLLVLSIFCAVFGFIFLKNTVKKITPHMLYIDAYETEMTLTYYTYGRYFKRVLHIRYEDILSARFRNSSCTSFQISFRESSSTNYKSYDINGKELPDSINNLMLFDLNPDSYEQGFFLYYASDLFTVKGFELGRKQLKMFGNQEEYFSRLEGE